MLLLSLLLVTAVQHGDCGPLSKEDDELGTTLDKELEDFLSQAIDDLPGKLDSDFQRVEGSGASASSHASASASASEEESKEHSMVTQMLSTLAETAKMSPYPEATNVVRRLIEEATNDEVRDLVRLASTLSGSTAESTTGGSVNDSTIDLGPTTSAIQVTDNFLESASARTSPSSTSASFATTTEGSANSTSWISLVDRSSESSKDSPPPMDSEVSSSSETDSISLKHTTVSPEAKTFKLKETTRSVLDASAIECVEENTCYGDTDCGQGVCLGVFLEKCNCHACVPNIECEDDSDCGGLRGACQDDVCRCAKALATHGFKYYIDALTKFCSQRSCTETSDSCFGLPCGRGICSCRK